MKPLLHVVPMLVEMVLSGLDGDPLILNHVLGSHPIGYQISKFVLKKVPVVA